MNILVLQPRRSLVYTYFSTLHSEFLLQGQLNSYRVSNKEKSILIQHLYTIQQLCADAGAVDRPDAISIRIPFGGTVFESHTIVTAETKQKLKDLIPFAPLHIPPILTLIECCLEVFSSLPVVLIFETALFTALPEREYLYALDSTITEQWELRRFGFNGIFHEAAWNQAASLHHEKERNQTAPSLRILSMCLEPQPEIAAIVNKQPIMVTSGVTPLEGLPGQTTCGELDSSIILRIAEKMEWGPEKINTVLTQESGLKGLTGRSIDWDELFISQSKDVQRIRDIIQYRILLACGAGVAAMSGADLIVFSGRYAKMGEILGPWLCSRMPFQKILNMSGKNPWICYTEPLDRILADMASLILLPTMSLVS